MNPIARDIFRAIHEGKWLSIEYRNKDDQITKYWIGIRDLNSIKRTLSADAAALRSVHRSGIKSYKDRGYFVLPSDRRFILSGQQGAGAGYL